MSGIAFFDVDRTLISANSATLWIRRELRLGHVSRMEALRGAFWLGVYALGFAPMETVLVDAVATLRGKREGEIRDRTLAFWREEVRALIRPAAPGAIARHRARGDRVYLLTSSSTYLSGELAAELGCDGFLCNRMEVADGLFTGGLARPVCYGAGKATVAAALAAELGVPMSRCAYYGDSYSDVPILAAVGAPVVVNPDLRLRRYARRQGWPIEDWDRRPQLPAAQLELPPAG